MGPAPIINLSLLEAHLRLHCRTLRHFLQLQSLAVVTGIIHDAFAFSRLLDFAASFPCVSLHHSRRLLLLIDNPNTFSFNRIIKAHVLRGYSDAAFSIYTSMLKHDHCLPDNYTYPILLQACASRFNRKEAEQVHAHVVELGFVSDVYVVNTLINAYSAVGDMASARQLFDADPMKLDSVSWNTILAGYIEAGDVEQAMWVFDQMPDKNAIATNSMIALFGRVNRVGHAQRLFDRMPDKGIVAWTSIISCYMQNVMYDDALEMFTRMYSGGILVDEIVLISALSVCARIGAAKKGEVIHSLVIKIGSDCYINLQNALIHMYSSCGNLSAAQRLFDSSEKLDQISWNSMISCHANSGCINDSRRLFDSMPQKDTVSWSTMIAGYVQHDQFAEALALFHELQLGSIRPDETTLVSVISACARLSSLEQGRWVHAYVTKNHYKINAILGTTLIDMYMKCGCVGNAIEVFNGMEQKGISSWNALIMGLAMNSLVRESLDKFSEMKTCGMMPNEITFVGVLGACRHAGLVDEGRQHFNTMTQLYNIAPTARHYGCMVDLLGRAGLLDEAEKLIENMPMAPDVATWGALLGSCRKHGNSRMGERIGKKLVQFEPQHDGFHVLLSNIYASRGRWDEAIQLRGVMKEHRVVKVPGCSLIEANGTVHEFLAGDAAHPQMKEIEKMIDEIIKRMKVDGYKPDTREITFDVDEEEKETSLYRHSEKLAIAFALISTSSPSPIRIMKNLRICNDCHVAAKVISKSFGREIIIRDRQRFHHFKEGLCSCVDFW